MVALDLSGASCPALGDASPIVGHLGPLGIALPQHHDQLTRGQGHPCVRSRRPPREVTLRKPLHTSPKRQNTSISDSPARQVTSVDPTHPLYGRTLPLLRMHSARSKARLVVRLPDGRVQWLPRAVTDLDASAVVTPPQALIAVPTLLPLAQLVYAMLTGKEDMHHDTAPALTRRVVNAPPTVPRDDLCGAPALMEQPGPQCAAATGPMPLRPDSADAGCPGSGSKGAQP